MLAAKLGLLLSLAAADEVELKADDGVKIAASWTKPGEAGKRPALLLVHMLGGKKEDWDGFAAAAAKAGCGVLAIDMRGHGKSENPFAKDREKKNVEKWTKDEWVNVLKDIRAAKDHLAGRADVDAKKIVLVGASIGANLSLHYAAADKDVRAVAVLSPGENYKGVSAVEAMNEYGARPFFGAASKDDPYPATSMERLVKMAKHLMKNSRMYASAGHGTKMFGNEDEPGDLTRELLEWVKAATR